MKKVLILCCFIISSAVFAQNTMSVSSPNGELTVTILVKAGKPMYSATYKGTIVLEDSPLGFITNEGDFSTNMNFVSSTTAKVEETYNQTKIKQATVNYKANTLNCLFTGFKDRKIAILFQVSNNNIAFRYEVPAWGDTKVCVISEEKTAYKFPSSTTTFLSPMMKAMTGFARTAPSYESGYEADLPVEKTLSSDGYVFPALFHLGDKAWVLLSETGVSSSYTASHLSAYKDGMYTVAYPNPKQNNGFGSSGAQIALPGTTPWRTITVGETLKPIVETTIPFDVVKPLYKASQEYKMGRGSWSWIVWQDNSMNYEDQVKYIDLAAAMKFEYILIDAWWDDRIGYEKMKELIKYAKSKNVEVFLWYNSNGSANDAFQTPLNKMNTTITRKNEMKWLKEAGVKGLKVDFFGGDKQETMKLYEDILSDANDNGLMIIFHGATLPRGWERMYPNFVGSEAVVASEMLIFSQDVREKEAFNASIHPFVRNAVGSMEFGGVLLNKFLNKGNSKGQERLTTDAFQLATAVLFQNPIQMFGLTPNNLQEVPAFELDFLKKVPTTWDETIFIDGYPGKYSVIARKHAEKWYVVGVNAEKTAKTLKLNLPMFAGQTVTMYNDKADKQTYTTTVKVSKKGELSITMQPNGGFVVTQ
ncbi:MAG: glycoside hydrolase family 97 catalytic domain-containing protein [Flavobacterium sp.]